MSQSPQTYRHFATKAVHAGTTPDPTTGAIMTPIYQTSTYVQEAPGKHKGYEYARTQNPTRTALQDCIAALENAQHGLCFSTGMGAVDAMAKLLKPGDEVVATNDLYGGTYRIFTKVFARYGVKFTFVPMHDIASIEAAITPATRMLWAESPTNPVLHIIDLAAVAAIAKKHGCMFVVDNTFASPALQNPLNLGADVVMHSVTKYLGGHSDVVMGALAMNDAATFEELKFIQNACGATPGPQDCFLALRGIKTLHLRMKAHCENAQIVAEHLERHPLIDRTYYPGLTSHPNHEVARRQMSGFSGMISFTLKGNSLEHAFRVASNFKIFSLAESLGGIESLVGHPASMTHGSIPKEEREKSGVVDSLLRLSVGIEHIEDLIDDLDQALKA